MVPLFFWVYWGRKGVQRPWGLESFSFKPQERGIIAPELLPESSREGRGVSYFSLQIFHRLGQT